MKFDNVYLRDFTDRVDVVCPRCGEKALVKKSDEADVPVRFSCPQCGYVKEWDGSLGIRATGNLKLNNNVVHMGGASDPYFRFSLWYQTPCCGELLWAYNRPHLKFYEEFIGDKLRERAQNEHGWSNQSLQNRLPQWMLAGKNRSNILKKIKQLYQK